MDAFVRKWGNSLALRIPGAVAKELDLREGSPVEISMEKDAVIIKRAKRGRPSLAQLLEKVTSSNLHAEQDWGGPVGREIW